MRDDEMTDKETRMFRANVAKFNNVKSEATKSCSLFSPGTSGSRSVCIRACGIIERKGRHDRSIHNETITS